MKAIFDKLNVTEEKAPKKQKIFNKIKDNIPLIKNYNYMADLLALPTDRNGSKYLFVMVDLATDKFDIQPMKNKDAKSTLDAMTKIFKRHILTKPEVSLTTDGGKEFLGVFHKYLDNNDIDHRVALPYRHKQLANVESLNRQLGRLLNAYMNKNEIETGKPYTDWVEIVPFVRKELNEFREKTLEKKIPKEQPTPQFDLNAKQVFKTGDIVFHKLEVPENALGHKQSTTQFRAGDSKWSKVPKEIVKVIMLPETPTFRYILEGMTNVSYSDNELKLAPSAEKQTKYVFKDIIGKKKMKGKTYYLIHWKGYTKKQSTWEEKGQLIEDGLENAILAYEKSIK